MERLIKFLGDSIIYKIAVIFCILFFISIFQSDSVKKTTPNFETVQAGDNRDLKNAEKPILEVHSGNINLNEEFDPFMFVDKAYSSKSDSDLKTLVRYESNVDVKKLGEYEIIFTLQIGEIIARERITVLVD